jgi:hypothetical protein
VESATADDVTQGLGTGPSSRISHLASPIVITSLLLLPPTNSNIVAFVETFLLYTAEDIRIAYPRLSADEFIPAPLSRIHSIPANN